MRTKPRHGRKPPDAASGPAKPQAARTASPPRARRNKWLIAGALGALAAVVSFSVFAWVLPGPIPQELVGEWRVAGGPLNGMTLEFKRNGTMTGRTTVDGQERVLEGSAAVEGNVLRTTTVNPGTGRAETGTQTIVTLTETDLVTEDARGSRVAMKRVR